MSKYEIIEDIEKQCIKLRKSSFNKYVMKQIEYAIEKLLINSLTKHGIEMFDEYYAKRMNKYNKLEIIECFLDALLNTDLEILDLYVR